MSNNIVLVHGAWHGAWCWAGVISELDRLGDRGYAVDLPGHGQNHWDCSQVKLATYVDSVVKFIEERDLRDVLIAGHSLGGLTISGVTAKIQAHQALRLRDRNRGARRQALPGPLIEPRREGDGRIA
jgi:pimeloyl-ACP methyl ester carboxylesterase